MVSTINDKVSPFLSYLQKRMDFIAQVATSAPSWCLLTDFDSLIDGFTKQYCLIKNIVRSHQGTENGPDFEPLIEKTYGEDRKDPPLLDIPHGEIGAQAFYTILENIVRNTAKYGDPAQLTKIKDIDGDGKLRFAIVVHDEWDDGGRGWVKDFYKVQIIDQLESATSDAFPNTAVAKLNTFLSEYLTDPITGVVKPKNWGMKEIKICAAYLRMVKQDEIDAKFEEWSTSKKPEEPPILQVSLESRNGRKQETAKHLAYTLYLLRPKQAQIVTDEPVADEEKLRLAGIDFSSLKKFLKEIAGGMRPRHTFIVLPKPRNSEEWNWLWKNLNFLPPRVLIRDCTEAEIPAGRPQLLRTLGFAPAKLPADPGLLMETLWTCWTNRWWGGYKIFVRDRRHANTIAEEGNQEDWDELATSQLLVFDHKAGQDKSILFQSAAYHQGFGHGSNVEQMLTQRAKDVVRAKIGKKIIQDAAKWTDTMADNHKRLRIKETAGLSVAVIDERVWLEKDGPATEGVRNYTGSTSRFDVWKKRRVFLQDANKALDNFSSFVENLDPEGIPVFDFIIIHQGIIDSAKEKEKDKKVFDAIWKTLKNRARWMVIDSGRGQPEQAREDNLRWVEYSNLAECLVQHAGDKFRLAELLWTLRASAKNGT
ncbi:MAG TPA: hypothetical protein VJ784_07990 [Pyrinomonadaceae bacterium]|jgi:hypothetical protein|nr:hypothetical protein [Pyrinomonadaceae bacterium]